MTEYALHARLIWAGGTHRFALPYLDGGLSRHMINDPHPRLRRILTGQWTAPDVVDTIEQALLHGRNGFTNDRVSLTAIMREHVLSRPLAEAAVVAKAVLLVALFGIPKHLADKAVPAETIANSATDEHAQAVGAA